MKAIVAIAKNLIIGNEGKIPWRCIEDLRFFKKMTTNQKIVVGRKTFEGLPFLPNREIYVLTRGKNISDKFQAAIEKWADKGTVPILINNVSDIPKDAIICGGGELYNTMFPKISEFYVTLINEEPEGDAKFPIAAFKRRFKEEGESIQKGDKYEIFKHKFERGKFTL